ncbi:cysteine hydrolase family protein [Rhodococcus xishaensis]|uniref:Cysteine hydrolase n=1 Tax=Rhodococcus xishaensis TaxID=2487364 RepID=A0A3S3DX41_9NOCA|nr:isochorismatase family cysteine hydrolase [Rhodococcus xishaensis]RVW00136.1 cysteine hydrolase [Rhodococcus xishaensis]
MTDKDIHNNTAMLVIDMQKESKYGIDGMQEAVDAAEQLIDACRSLSIPIIYTRHVGRADGRGLVKNDVLDSEGKPVFYRSDTPDLQVIDQIKPRLDDVVIDKYRWSGFYETPLDLLLRTERIETLIVVGFVTDGCVLTTVFDAFARNYDIVLVKDACAATNSGAHKSAVLTMGNWVYGIEIIDSNEMLKKLEGSPYASWTSSAPDLLAHSSDKLDECYASLSGEFKGVSGEFKGVESDGR